MCSSSRHNSSISSDSERRKTGSKEISDLNATSTACTEVVGCSTENRTFHFSTLKHPQAEEIISATDWQNMVPVADAEGVRSEGTINEGAEFPTRFLLTSGMLSAPGPISTTAVYFPSSRTAFIAAT